MSLPGAGGSDSPGPSPFPFCLHASLGVEDGCSWVELVQPPGLQSWGVGGALSAPTSHKQQGALCTFSTPALWSLKSNALLWKTGLGEEGLFQGPIGRSWSQLGRGCRGLPPAWEDRVVGIRAQEDTGRGL